MFAQRKIPSRGLYLSGFLLLLVTGATLVLSRGSAAGQIGARKNVEIGSDRLVAWEQLPVLNGPMCEFLPASAQPASAREEELFALRLSTLRSFPATHPADGLPPRPSEAVREAVDPKSKTVMVSDKALNAVLAFRVPEAF